MFKNQQKEFFLYENRLLKNRINKVSHSIDANVLRSKVYSLNEESNNASKDLTHGSRMYSHHHVKKIHQNNNNNNESKELSNTQKEKERSF